MSLLDYSYRVGHSNGRQQCRPYGLFSYVRVRRGGWLGFAAMPALWA